MDRRIIGDVGEYLVNNTFYHELGAIRYGSIKSNFYLFDGIVIPANPASNRLVEIDHLLISQKGVFVIETKNIGGIITAKGDYWGVQERNGRMRKMYSPIKQNYSHLLAAREHLYKFYIERGLFGAVVVVRASLNGWCPARFAGYPPQNVYTDPVFLAQKIRAKQAVLSSREVEMLAKHFSFYYRKRASLKEAHIRQVREKQRRYQYA